MRKHLKNYFIPHEGNSYHPHFWHRSSIHFIFLFIIVTFISGILFDRAVRETQLDAQILPIVLVKLANEDRLKNNVNELIENPLLVKSATLKGEDMSENGYFAHTSPDGIDPWYWFDMAGYNFYYAGENLAVHFTDSSMLEDAWLASPTHRKNILNTQFTEVGIAVVEGEYEGFPTMFVVQHFGTPSIQERTGVVAAQEEAPKENDVVQGATAQAQEPVDPAPSVVAKKPPTNVTVISEDSQTVYAKNNDETLAPQTPQQSVLQDTKVTLPERFVVNPALFIKFIYLFVGIIIAITLFLFVFIEIRKQHISSILSGILLIVLMFLSYQIFLQFIGRHFIFVS